MSPAPDELLTCREAAACMHVDVETVYRWVRKRAITSMRIGPTRLIRIPRSVVESNIVVVPGASN